jgi:hypothetical protein
MCFFFYYCGCLVELNKGRAFWERGGVVRVSVCFGLWYVVVLTSFI